MHIHNKVSALRGLNQKELLFHNNILSNIRDSVIVTDLGGKITYWNNGAETIFGYTSKEMMGRDIAYLYPEINPQQMSADLKDILSGNEYLGSWKGRRKNGESVWVDIRSTIMRTNGDEAIGFIGTSRDATARIAANTLALIRIRQLEAVSELGIKALQTMSLTELYDAAMLLLKKNLPIEFVKILELDSTGESLTIRAGLGWNKSVKMGVTRVDKGNNSFAGYVLLTNEPLIVDDLKTDKRFDHPKLLFDHKVISGMSVIIHGKTGKPWGVLGVHSRKKQIFTQDDINFLQSVANILASAISRHYTSHELNDSQKLLDTILQAMDQGVTVQDKNGTLIYANDSAVKAVGYEKREDIEQKHLQQIYNDHLYQISMFDEEGKPIDYGDLPGRKALLGESNPEQTLKYVNNETHETKWVRVMARPIIDSEGDIQAAVNVIHDITDQKRALDTQTFMAEVGKILSQSLDYEEILQKIASLATPLIADWCVIDFIDTEKNSVKIMAAAHQQPEKIKFAKMLRKKYPVNLSGPGPIQEAIRSGTTQYLKEITDEMLLAAAGGDPKRHRLLRKVGYYSLVVVPIKLHDSTIGAITLVNTDISKRHFNSNDVYMAEQLGLQIGLSVENSIIFKDSQYERNRLVELITTVPGVVWEAWGAPDAKKQQIDFVSKYVEKMLGYSQDEWLSTPNFWLKIVHPDDKRRASQEAAHHFSHGTGGVSRFRWLKKSGDAIWVEAHTFVIKDSRGNPVGMRGVTMDITERVEMEERKNDFISMASHELKTPLTSIKAFNQILRAIEAKEGTSRTQTYLAKMDKQIDKLTYLISDLLDVSKIQQGRLDYYMEEIDVAELIGDIVANLQQTSPTHNLIIKGKVKNKIWGDYDRLGQVFINLISNAIKYSPDSQDVLILLNESSDSVTISVRDYGVGIEKKHLPKIFDRFYRITSDSKIKYPGLGIGLFIVNEIVSRHGGKIKVDSSLSRGSTFTVNLPAAAHIAGESRVYA